MPFPASRTASQAGSRDARESSLIRVLAAVIRRGGEVLLCQRPEHKRHGGLWEFPGGKLEPGETLLDAARRELGEELEVNVSTVGVVVFQRRDPGSIYLIEFADVSISGEPRAVEHTALMWIEPARAAALPLAPADRAYLEHLLSSS